MSPVTSIAGAVWRQLPFFVWLIALWMLLWATPGKPGTTCATTCGRLTSV